MDARGGTTKDTKTPLYWTDGRTTKYTELLNWYTVGLKSGSSTSTISKIDISHEAPFRQRLRYESILNMKSVGSKKQDNCVNDQIKIISSSPTTLRMVESQLEDIFLVIFILNMNRKPNQVEIFILGPSMARVTLSWMARQRMVGPATTTTTPESRSD